MNYDNNNTYWWLLQVQLPDRHGNQQDLFSAPIPRQDLLRQSLTLIPEKIRISRGSSTWGLANLIKIKEELFSFYLTIHPPNARIGEEPKPGHLKDAKDPRYYTLCVFNVQKQILMVHKSSDVSRFARSARTFAYIFQAFIEKAVSNLNMAQHYLVEVDPIAQVGSFVEWVNSLDILKKIIIKHTGSNLPAGNSTLINDIKESARQLKGALKSKDVELVANEPELHDEEVVELDKAVADRRLKLRARGVKSGVGTTWSSSEKPIPETAIMPIEEEKLQDGKFVARIIDIYINERLEKR